MIRTTLSLRRRTATALALLLTCTASLAQTWTGGGDGVSWNQSPNWTSLPVSGPGAYLQFQNPAAIVTNQNLGNPFVLAGLQANGPGGLTVNGNPLSFNNGANDALIYGNAIPLTVNVPIVMSSNLQFNMSSLGTGSFTGGVSGAGQMRVVLGTNILSGPGTWTGGTEVGYGSGQGTLRIAAANALTTTGPIGISSAANLEFNSPVGFTVSNTLVGGGTVRQMGAGTVLLNGNSPAWNGLAEVTGGTLRLGHVNAIGTGNSQASVLNGTLQLAVNDALTPAQNSTSISPSGTLDLAGFSQTSAVNVTNNGAILLPAGSSLAVGGFNTWTGSSSGAGSLSFAGFTTLNAGANLQHTGGTTVPGGQFSVNASNSLPDTGLLQVSGGGFFSHSGTETVDSVLVAGGNLGATALTVTNSMAMQAGTAGGGITVNGPFTKTTAGAAQINGGTFTLNGGGTVSAGTLDVFNATINGAFNNSTGTTTISSGGILNGPTTNTNILNVVNGGVIAGTVSNAGTLDLANGGIVTAAVNNTGLVSFSGFGALVSGNITGNGQFLATSASGTLSGVNSYSGGSTLVASIVGGHTDSIQGAWSLNANSVLDFNQNFNGTMAGNISGTGGVQLSGSGIITLSGNNNFQSGVLIAGFGTQFGVGSNNAAGSGGTIQGSNFKMSAEGGARTLGNPFIFGNAQTEFTGVNNLTLNNAGAKSVGGTAVILHTSTATTTVGGAFLGQNTTTIDVNAGTLVLGAPVNNGFRMDGAINVASGATLQMISNSPVKLGPTNLNGGTLVAANGVAVPTGLALTATGAIQGRVSSEAGSLIEATGSLTLGDSTNFAGFFSNGELRTQQHSVTLLDKNQAVLGSLTEIGTPSLTGVLTAANGVYVDFGRAITGYGTVASTNALAQAVIINGDAAGSSPSQQLDFTGYVKGLGTFTDVTFSGTFSPGLSPAIVPVNNVSLGNSAILVMEIGGLTPGSQHDQLDIGGVLALNGTLDVDLINGFNPSFGNVFNILDGSTTGTFNTFSFPALSPGLSWDTSDLYSLGNLKIVPEPSAALLALLTAAGLLVRRRR